MRSTILRNSNSFSRVIRSPVWVGPWWKSASEIASLLWMGIPKKTLLLFGNMVSISERPSIPYEPCRGHIVLRARRLARPTGPTSTLTQRFRLARPLKSEQFRLTSVSHQKIKRTADPWFSRFMASDVSLKSNIVKCATRLSAGFALSA